MGGHPGPGGDRVDVHVQGDESFRLPVQAESGKPGFLFSLTQGDEVRQGAAIGMAAQLQPSD